MADPAFCQKMVLELCLSGGVSIAHEAKIRGDKFSKVGTDLHKFPGKTHLTCKEIRQSLHHI